MEGGEEFVMMEAEGPGAIVRFWSANPTGKVRFYIDGAAEPALTVPLVSLDSSTLPSWLAIDVNVTVVGPAFTTCGEALLVPLLFDQSPTPVNAAVRTWLPAVSAEVVKDARPVASTLTFEAHTVAPSVKVTLPTGVPEEEVTVAVNVTGCPSVEGFGDEVSEPDEVAACEKCWLVCTARTGLRRRPHAALGWVAREQSLRLMGGRAPA